MNLKSHKYREKAAKIIQNWWKEIKIVNTYRLKKIILIQSVYRGKCIRKNLYDLLYLCYLCDCFFKRIENVLLINLKSYAYEKLFYNGKYKKENYIIAEINIKEEDINKDKRIINSFEYLIRTGSIYGIKKKDYYLYENEEDIKDNCKIKINNNDIDFNYFYKFKEKGNYIIKYIFTNNLTKTDFMFYGCKSLTYINLSNFNTQNVKNMEGMFGKCESLIKINLSSFNGQNVTNMNGIFSGCKSLKKDNIITKNEKILNEFYN